PALRLSRPTHPAHVKVPAPSLDAGAPRGRDSEAIALPAEKYGRGGGRRLLRRLGHNKLALVGLVLTATIVALAVFGPLVWRTGPDNQDLVFKLRPGFWGHGGFKHPLGTDQLGRDLLSRILAGARISLVVGALSVVVSGAFGTVVGLLSGFARGWLDDLAMRLTDVELAIPLTLLAIAILAVVGTSLAKLIVVISVTQWMIYARVVRAETMSVANRDFVEAARATGARNGRILFRHILPNVLPSIIVVATLGVATVIVLEAGLSFLGLGVQPPQPSLGGMLSEGRDYFYRAWWLGTFPGLMIMLIVLGINMLGDGLRDLLDPRNL
ncbi:MAG: ABC transporter permease, partial [Chloroflexota bacterium]